MEAPMEMDRRKFVQLSVGTLVGCAMCGCASGSGGQEAPMPAKAGTPIDAGPSSQYETDGIYDAQKEKGFFIVRHGADLFAISSICTHQRCKLRPEPNHTIL